MRLLMTTDTVGGVWTFTTELAEQLLGRGHRVHVVSFGRAPSDDQRAWCADHLKRGAALTHLFSELPLEWMQNNEHVFERGQRILLAEIQTFRPDLILSNQFCFGRLHTPVPRIVVAHSDVLSWARACRPSALEPSPWLTRYTAMVQAGLLDAAAVVAPTAWMGKALAANFSLPHNFVLIANGLHMAPAHTTAPPRKLQVITAGRLWDEAKGLDVLNDAQLPVPLLVAGAAAHESATNKALPPQTRLLGELSRPLLHEFFRQSAIYLCTSRYEPFGLAPLEAALCGCAVVARDIPSLREVWADAAVYFHDAASLTAALHYLADIPRALEHAQNEALRRASAFTAAHTADAYLRLFEAVLPHAQTMPHVA